MTIDGFRCSCLRKPAPHSGSSCSLTNEAGVLKNANHLDLEDRFLLQPADEEHFGLVKALLLGNRRADAEVGRRLIDRGGFDKGVHYVVSHGDTIAFRH